MTSTKISTEVITDADVRDTVYTAAYGGITYWAEDPCEEDFAHDPHPKDTVATIRDSIDDKVFFLTADRIREAIVKIAVNDPRIVNETIQGYVVAAFESEDTDYDDEPHGLDGGHIDADAADAIVQIACFGELVYG